VKALDLSAEQLVKVVSHIGGSKNLAALLSADAAQVKALDLSAEQLVNVVSHGGGSKNLAALLSVDAAQVKALDLSAEQLVNVVSHIGGSKNLAALLSADAAQVKTLDLSAEQLVKVVSHGGGSKNLAALLSVDINQVRALRLTSKDLVKILRHDGGSKSLKALLSVDINQVNDRGLTSDDLFEVVSHGGGSNNLKALLAVDINQLRVLDLTGEDLVGVLSHGGGAKNLKALLEKMSGLREKGFSIAHLVYIASNKASSKFIELLAEVVDRLPLKAESDFEQIVALAKKGSKGREQLKALATPNEVFSERSESESGHKKRKSTESSSTTAGNKRMKASTLAILEDKGISAIAKEINCSGKQTISVYAKTLGCTWHQLKTFLNTNDTNFERLKKLTAEEVAQKFPEPARERTVMASGSGTVPACHTVLMQAASHQDSMSSSLQEQGVNAQSSARSPYAFFSGQLNSQLLVSTMSMPEATSTNQEILTQNPDGLETNPMIVDDDEFLTEEEFNELWLSRPSS
ncbi:MAG: TAL effector repeat-containing protein, partial [bacterium]|nr:TAL effector repeat-containing protein [bacterium]